MWSSDRGLDHTDLKNEVVKYINLMNIFASPMVDVELKFDCILKNK